MTPGLLRGAMAGAAGTTELNAATCPLPQPEVRPDGIMLAPSGGRPYPLERPSRPGAHPAR